MKTLLRFFLYVRKSQGRSDRQMLSIPAQIEEMKAFAKRHGIQIIMVFEEARTAKEPGRPVFNEMLDRIEKGEAEGILAWKVDRLSRNPIDDGRISWMLQRGEIKQIQTIERSYFPEDNVLFMRMEQGMANQYVIDLGKNVKRGMRNSAMSGWLPVSTLPLGYKRNLDKKASNKILKNTKQFNIVRELWKLYGTGIYSIPEIKKIAEQLGLKTSKGKHPNKHAYRNMFKNSFYAGYYFWNDINGNRVRIEGKHPAMISEAEFLKVQDVISGRHRKTRAKKYEFAYKGVITCGECSGQVTGEKKHRTTCTKCKRRFSSLHLQGCPSCGLKIADMKNPVVFSKTYYRCTKGKNFSCTQKGVSEKEIEESIISALSKIELTQTSYEWARKKISKYTPTHEDSPTLLESLKKKRNEIDKKITRLVDLRVSGEISKEQCNRMHEEYKITLEEVNKEIVTREASQELWKQEADKYLEFALNCVNKFKNASNFKKREIMSVFLTRQTLLDKTLYFSTKKPLNAIFPVQSDSSELRRNNAITIQKTA